MDIKTSGFWREELRWWSSRGTLRLCPPSNTARYLSNHYKHPQHQSDKTKTASLQVEKRPHLKDEELTWGRYSYGYRGREGALLTEATAKYCKQQSAKSEPLEVCYHGGMALA